MSIGRMYKWAYVATALIAVAVLAGGCGSGGSDRGTTTAGANPATVPAGDVAVVRGTAITQAQFDNALRQTELAENKKTVPAPGDPDYTEGRDAAMGELLDQAWITGEAADQGVTVSDREIADALAQTKRQNFKTEAEFQAYVKKAGYTAEDVNERVKLQVLSQKLETKIAGATKLSQKQQAAFAAYIKEYKAKWTAVTLCADGYQMDRCSNGPPASTTTPTIPGVTPAPAPSPAPAPAPAG
jgi:parvulin-like peptidyl-prolyl isomerase